MVLSLWLACGATVRAEGIESVVSPGEVIQGHLKWESECKQCHIMFDRAAQDRLCMACHKEIGQDVQGKRRYHGLMKPQPCRTCHTDHKGRKASIIALDTKQFDHGLTVYALRGKHQKAECKTCHEAGKKYRLAPKDCNGCHRKDDVHKASLGPKCADCHTENNWKEAKLDHDKTRFVLTNKHIDVKCADCHKDKNYKETPHACVACHKKDDDGSKGHKGLFGEKCETCHGTKLWKTTTLFDHDVDTKYPLRGKHETTKCVTCHIGHLYKVKLSQACVDCHAKDDKHKDTLGKKCGACHTERNWKESPGFDHAKSDFPLGGKHAKVECKTCHKNALYKEAPKECIGCHKKDDKHQATLGEKCGDCHNDRDWKEVNRFDHNRSKFPLRNAHAKPKVQCKDCHVDVRHYRNVPMDCYSCHKKDDKHEEQLTVKCENCHDDQSWKAPGFNHAKSRYPLTGRHQVVACKECHITLRYKDAKSDCYSCHKKADKHVFKFGAACESCHITRGWGIWEFNHDKRSRYKLDGKHVNVACEACHKQRAPEGKLFAEVGSSCTTCHRKDDVHDGGFGQTCEKCHTTNRWKEIRMRTGSSGSAAKTLASARDWDLGRSSHRAPYAIDMNVMNTGWKP
jgi:hypothetical protein